MAHASIDRSRRVAGLLQRELSELILSELGDPRLEGVTVTDVRISKDLRQATAFVSRLDEAGTTDGGANREHDYVDVLNRASGVLRRHLGTRLSMKITPRVEFQYDDTLARGFRISQLIDDNVEGQSDDSGDGESKPGR